MSRLTIDGAKKIIEFNRQTLYHLPNKYHGINHYLTGNTRKTLLEIYRFISDKQIQIQDHKYCFFLDFTSAFRKVRQGKSSKRSIVGYINMLCALGFITKEEDNRTAANKNFLITTGSTRSMNLYSFTRYTDKELDRIETRAGQLLAVNVTLSSLSYNMLILNGLEDMAGEVYPHNRKEAPQVKCEEYQHLEQWLHWIIDLTGYATKTMLIQEAALPAEETERLLRIFRDEIRNTFDYKRPTKEQLEKYRLPSCKWIFTKKHHSE